MLTDTLTGDRQHKSNRAHTRRRKVGKERVTGVTAGFNARRNIDTRRRGVQRVCATMTPAALLPSSARESRPQNDHGAVNRAHVRTCCRVMTHANPAVISFRTRALPEVELGGKSMQV